MYRILTSLALLALVCAASADNHRIVVAIDPADTIFVPGAGDAPDELVLSDISEDSLRVAWRDLSTAEQSFVAFYRRIEDDANNAWLRGGSAAGSPPGETGGTFSARIDGLRPGRGYCVSVAALHAGRLRLDGGNEVCTRTLGEPVDYPRPAPPSVIHFGIDHMRASLVWRDESTSETEFRVWRRGAGLDWQVINTIILVGQTIPSSTRRSYQYTDLTPYRDRENCYRVTALNVDFEAHSSVHCSVTYPYPTHDLEVTARRADGFSLRWTDYAENEDGYFVTHCRVFDGGTVEESCTDTASVGPFDGEGTMEVSGLQPSTDYQLTLYSFNAGVARYFNSDVEARTRPGQPTIEGVELFYNSSLNLVPFNPSSTQTMTLDWFVCNAGQETPSKKWVTSVGVFREGILVDEDEVDGVALATGECQHQAVKIGPLQAGNYSLMTVLDGKMAIVEADEGNNTLTYGLIIAD